MVRLVIWDAIAPIVTSLLCMKNFAATTSIVMAAGCMNLVPGYLQLRKSEM